MYGCETRAQVWNLRSSCTTPPQAAATTSQANLPWPCWNTTTLPGRFQALVAIPVPCQPPTAQGPPGFLALMCDALRSLLPPHSQVPSRVRLPHSTLGMPTHVKPHDLHSPLAPRSPRVRLPHSTLGMPTHVKPPLPPRSQVPSRVRLPHSRAAAEARTYPGTYRGLQLLGIRAQAGCAAHAGMPGAQRQGKSSKGRSTAWRRWRRPAKL
eukprot:343596-Chlamydomonas_euryale.AAC.4